MTRPRTHHVVMLLALVAALGLGAAEFPRAEEPGRAESNGVTLSLAGARLDGAGDWAIASPALSARHTHEGVWLRVEAGGRAYEFVSRNLPVFAHTCYSIRVEGRVLRSRIGLQVTKADLGAALSADVPLSQATRARGLVFSSGGERRIVVAFTGTAGAAAIVRVVRLTRLSDRWPARSAPCLDARQRGPTGLRRVEHLTIVSP